jgi:hypothetical protein
MPDKIDVVELDKRVASALEKMKLGQIDKVTPTEINAVWLFAEECFAAKYPTPPTGEKK